MLLPSLLLSLTACGEPTTPPAEAVWYPNVQRMVNTQCADCHHVGGQGPFPLETYETASGTAQAMLTAMESGSMPPWHADPDCRHFEGERILSAEDLDLFRFVETADEAWETLQQVYGLGQTERGESASGW